MSRVQKILHWIWENSPVTQAQISKNFSLNIAIVNTQINELLRWGIVVYDGFASSSGGRKARLIKLNPNLGYFGVLRISRNTIKASIVDINADIIYLQKEYIYNIKTKSDLLNKIYASTDSIIEKAKEKNITISRIGISIAGLVNSEKGISVGFPRVQDWKEVSLKMLIEKRYKIATDVENDIYASTHAIRFLKKSNDYHNILYIQIGPGIGAGFIIKGKVYKSPLKYFGELGHIVIDKDGPLCYCGQQGCLESIASEFSIIDRVKKILNKGAKSIITEYYDPLTEEPTIDHILKGAEEKDRICCQVLEKAGYYLGIGISNLINILGPEKIYIGGTLLSNNSEIILESIKRQIYSHTLNQLDKDFFIEIVKEKNIALKGIAYLSIEKYLYKNIYSKILEK